MSRRRLWLLVVALSVAGLAAALSGGATAASWGAPRTLSMRGLTSTYPGVGFDGRGHAVAIWATARTAMDYVIRSSTFSVSIGAWSRPASLTPPGQFEDFPQIAVDPLGAAVAVWQSGGVSLDGGRTAPEGIEAAFRRSPQGAWQKPVRIAGVETYNAVVGIDARGQAMAVWGAPFGVRSTQIESATGSVRTGRWSRPVALATGRQLLLPRLAVDGRGVAVAVWEAYRSGSALSGVRHAVYAAVKPAGQARWRRAVDLGTEMEGPASPDSELPGPRVAVDSDGNAVVVWQVERRGDFFTDASSVSAGSGRASRPSLVSSVAGIEPDVAIDARGDATVVWDALDGRVLTASRSSGACGWSTASALSRPAITAHPHVAVNARGDAIADWGGQAAVQMTIRPGPNGPWQRPTTLDSGGTMGQAIDARGDAIVVWRHPASHGVLVQAAAYTAPGRSATVGRAAGRSA